MSLLELKQVSKTYEKEVLSCINLKVEKGEILGIVGRSGCGKSTLGKLIAGIEQPSTGKIVFNGQLFDVKKERRAIQLIFQNPIDSFSPRLKIRHFLYEPYHYFYHLNKKNALPKMIHILHQVGLDETCLSKYPHELSGGQLQRIAIARALIIQPEVLICDEITSSIDHAIQKEIIALLKSFVEEYQTTILFISHDLALVQSFCKHIIVIQDGAIIENCNGQDLVKSKNQKVQALMEASYLQKEEFALNL